jgi:5-methyltetrahydrofolate--homocysteine methyltransferase
MNGLEIANKLIDPTGKETLFADLKERQKKWGDQETEVAKPKLTIATDRSPHVKILAANPIPPDFKKHVQRNIPITQIWKYINPLMLYTRHLGIKGKTAKNFELLLKDAPLARKMKQEEPSAFQIWEKVEEVKAEYGGSEIMRPKAIYRFFKAASHGNSTLIYLDPSDTKPAARLDFDRQTKGETLCLSDYLAPVDTLPDSMAMFVTTVGPGIREEAARLKGRGDFLKSHILAALAIETAEAYAEQLHGFIRSSWGFPDDPAMTMMERFQAKYRGKRFSFGYPACPRLEDQSLLFELLHPQEIGVELTEGFMMDPESSVSAIVFHHPDASYFSVGPSRQT